MSKVKVNVARLFVPHSMLLSAADKAIKSASLKEVGYWYDWLSAILFCSLSIEAIGNTYGETFIHRWKDFESSSPAAKIRIVAEHCGLNPDFSKHPWSSVPELISFRNRVAHAKLEDIKVESLHHVDHYQKHLYSMPASKLEKMVTEEFARNSYDCIYEILLLLGAALPSSKVIELEMGGWSGDASVL